jgi:hypothetical protein
MVTRRFAFVCLLLTGCGAAAQDAATPARTIDPVDDAEVELDGGSRLPQDLPGHAQEFETSIALAEFPENLRTEVWTAQPDSTAAMATAEKGRELLSRIVDRVGSYLEEMMDGRRGAEVPPYEP